MNRLVVAILLQALEVIKYQMPGGFGLLHYYQIVK